MTTALTLFSSTQFGSVRTTNIDGEIYFVAMDLAKILEYSETSRMLGLLKGKHITRILVEGSHGNSPYRGTSYGVESSSTSEVDRVTSYGVIDDIENDYNQSRELLFVNEPGLYKCIFGSTKPEAERFSDWITEEVIPTIRKTGSYSLSAPKTYIEALEEIIKVEKEKERLLLESSKQKETIKQLEILVDDNDSYSTVLGYFLSFDQQIDRTTAASIGKETVRYCKVEELEVKKAQDDRYRYVNTYPVIALKKVLLSLGYKFFL